MTDTVDLTPTWAAAVDILIMSLQAGSPLGQQAAREELMRIASWLDNNYSSHAPRTDPADVDLASQWQNHPDWPVVDWQLEVANNDTRLGYLDWVAVRIVKADIEA